MSSDDFTSDSFNAHLADHRIMGSRCKKCGALYLPPRPLCTACYGEGMEWVEMPQDGELVAYTQVRVAPSAMLQAGYDRDHPYFSGIVRLSNGLSVSAQILCADGLDPSAVEIGSPLTAEFIQRQAGEAPRTFLAFRLSA